MPSRRSKISLAVFVFEITPEKVVSRATELAEPRSTITPERSGTSMVYSPGGIMAPPAANSKGTVALATGDCALAARANALSAPIKNAVFRNRVIILETPLKSLICNVGSLDVLRAHDGALNRDGR